MDSGSQVWIYVVMSSELGYVSEPEDNTSGSGA